MEHIQEKLHNNNQILTSLVIILNYIFDTVYIIITPLSSYTYRAFSRVGCLATTVLSSSRAVSKLPEMVHNQILFHKGHSLELNLKIDY